MTSDLSFGVPSDVKPGPAHSSPGFSPWRMMSRVSIDTSAGWKSIQADALAECLLAHRDVLAGQVAAVVVAEIDQSAHCVLDRREVGARDLAHRIHARGADLDLHVGVDGAGREAEDANAGGFQHQRAGQHG